MLRLSIVFLTLCFLGLVIQSTVFHALSFSVVAPDFILILVVYLALHHRSVLGVFGAFLLGLAADFASGQFVGPNAAGAIVAYNVALLISQKIYAEHPLAVMLISSLCSLVKIFVFSMMIRMYTAVDVLEGHYSTLMLEALVTGLIAPIVLKIVQWSSHGTPALTSQRREALRWSLRTR